MTVVHIRALKPQTSFQITKNRRYVFIEGLPECINTYGEVVSFYQDGAKISEPSKVFFNIQPDVQITRDEGEDKCSYVPAFSDAELGIDEPDQLEVEIYLSPDSFKELWRWAMEEPRVTGEISFGASRTDISGYMAYLDVNKHGVGTWKIDGFRFYVNVHDPYLVEEANHEHENAVPEEKAEILQELGAWTNTIHQELQRIGNRIQGATVWGIVVGAGLLLAIIFS